MTSHRLPVCPAFVTCICRAICAGSDAFCRSRSHKKYFTYFENSELAANAAKAAHPSASASGALRTSIARRDRHISSPSKDRRWFVYAAVPPLARQGVSAQRGPKDPRGGATPASSIGRSRRGHGGRDTVRNRPPRARAALSRDRLTHDRFDGADLRAWRQRTPFRLRLPALRLVAAVPERWHVSALPRFAGGVPC